MSVPADPIAALGGLAAYGKALRSGRTTAVEAARAYLARIAAYDGKLGAYECLMPESALATAQAMDTLLATGTHLGPLMGVPIAVKDLFAVDGAPTNCGSVVDVSDLVGAEGTFVRMLRQAGCIILGKTKTVEFALGGHGTNWVRGTPVNPCDSATPRLPGGSSSGSAVAMAAGLCAVAIGSDTGGSVRGPAAWCGVFGLKTSVGLWPTDGVFPLSRLLDTIGPLTRTASDAAIFFATLTGSEVPLPAPADGLRLGKPTRTFFEDMDGTVAPCINAALDKLAAAGATLVDVEIPDCDEAQRVSAVLRSPELLASLGRERFLANRHKMDRHVAERTAAGLDTMADTWIRASRSQDRLRDEAARSMAGLDAWVTPTKQMVAPTLAECMDDDAWRRLAAPQSRNTRPNNAFGQCAAAVPIHGLGADLPVSLQVVCNGGDDAKLLSIALTVEQVIGEAPSPDLSGFN